MGYKSKEAAKAYSREYIKKNSVRLKAYQKLWRRQNPEKSTASQLRYKTKHPGKYLETKRKWRERNPEKVKAMNDKQRAKGNWTGYMRAWRRKKLVSPPPYEPPDRCEACGRQLLKPNLDHCHTTNRFRGWLCNPCNAALGLAGDTADGVKRLLDYIVRAEAMIDSQLID